MNTKKQYPNDKLQKSSKLFLQLGLVIALFISYLVLESSSTSRALASVSPPDVNTDEVYIMPEAPEKYIVERKASPKQEPKQIKKPQQLDKFLKQEDVAPDAETIFEPEDPKEDDLDLIINNLPDDNKDKEEDIELEYFKVEIKPTFKECANLSGLSQSQCFQKQVQRYINKNLEYPEDAIDAGKQGRATIEFIIDEKGQVKDVKTYNGKTLFKSLDEAAIKAVSKLPKMIPGKQGNKNVKVKYVVPVKFKLY